LLKYSNFNKGPGGSVS